MATPSTDTDRNCGAARRAQAASVLRTGGVVAIPTDTVYGIAASLDHPDAIERLFEIKGREQTKAIPVLVSSPDVSPRLTTVMSVSARRLTEVFWPGALTIVVTASPEVPLAVLRGGTTVGLRMPDNADALAIIAGSGGAIAVTSANRSGETEAQTAAEVVAALGTSIDFVFDGGEPGLAVPSTVVDVTTAPIRVLRRGAINVGRIMTIVGEVE